MAYLSESFVHRYLKAHQCRQIGPAALSGGAARFPGRTFHFPKLSVEKGIGCGRSRGNVERVEAAGAESSGGISTCNTCAIPLYSPFPRRRPCYRSSMAEHWFCKPDVVGSTPTGSFPRGKYGVSGLRGRVGTLLQLLTRASINDTRQQGSVRVVAGIYRRVNGIWADGRAANGTRL